MPAPGDQHQDTNKTTSTSSFTNKNYSTQELAELRTVLDKRLGPEYVSQRAGPGGRKIPYITGDKCINLANQVFGFNGWSSSIQNIQTDFVEEPSPGKINLGLSAIVRITLKDGTFHEDIGCGEAENVRGKAAAFTKAKKSAVTDGIKRTLRHFGEVFNCVGDADFVKRILKMKPPARAFDEANLLRHPDAIRPIKPLSNAPNQNSTAILAHEKSTMSEDYGGDDLEDADFDICVEDEEYDGLVDDESLVNMLPTPSKPSRAESVVADKLNDFRRNTTPQPQIKIETPQITQRTQPANQIGSNAQNSSRQIPPPKTYASSNTNGQQNGTTIGNGSGGFNGQPPYRQQNGAPSTIPRGNQNDSSTAGNASRMVVTGTSAPIAPAQSTDMDQPASTTFFSARAAIQENGSMESMIFDPRREAQSIPRTAGVDHSKSSPVPRTSRFPMDPPKGAAVNARPNFNSGNQVNKPGPQTPINTSGTRSYKPPVMNGAQTPGQIPYPALTSNKRTSDGYPANNGKSTPPSSATVPTRSALNDASKAQLNVQQQNTVSTEQSETISNEMASKRLRT